MDNVAICHPDIKEGCHESTCLNIKGYISQLEPYKYDKKIQNLKFVVLFENYGYYYKL